MMKMAMASSCWGTLLLVLSTSSSCSSFILFFSRFADAVIKPGDTNARWYADFSLQLNLTEVTNLLESEDAAALQEPSVVDLGSSSAVRSLISREIAPLAITKKGLLQVHAAVFQEDVREYWTGQGSGVGCLPLALFLSSSPLALQQQLLQECPMLMAAAYLLSAEVLAYTHDDLGIAAHKYEVARYLGGENPDHTAAWAFPFGLRRFEAAARLKRKSAKVDVVISHCREDLLEWLPTQFAPLFDPSSDLPPQYVTRFRIFVYHKCGPLPVEQETALFNKMGLKVDSASEVRKMRDSDAAKLEAIQKEYQKESSSPSKTAEHRDDPKRSKTKHQPGPPTHLPPRVVKLSAAGAHLEVEFFFQELRNYAMESLGYATHLAVYDDHSSDVLFFLQGEPMHHQVPQLLQAAVSMVQAGTFLSSGIGFLHLNQRRFLGSSHECVYELLEKMGFGEVQTFAGYCCSQFVVARENVLAPEDSRKEVDEDDNHDSVNNSNNNMIGTSSTTSASKKDQKSAYSSVLGDIVRNVASAEAQETRVDVYALQRLEEAATHGGPQDKVITSLQNATRSTSTQQNAYGYRQARKLLNQEIRIKCSQDTAHDARPGIHTSALYEHMWQVLFKREGILPMRKNDFTLPFFMRNEGEDSVFGNFVLESIARKSFTKSMFA
ncbi:unnamed protein product [Amoebophrya sp. A25]|nr:unnamed protein product [Amoebophrya sp. A25]|eukprot:GSA25T00004510001.1